MNLSNIVDTKKFLFGLVSRVFVAQILLRFAQVYPCFFAGMHRGLAPRPASGKLIIVGIIV